jgi:transposase
VVDAVTNNGEATLITARPASKGCACPGCGARSERIHRRYQRRLADLPMVGKPVWLVVVACRFHCDAALCARRIFAERFGGDVLTPWADEPLASTSSSTISALLWADARRRNQRYGTIICDLERRKTIALLPDREPAIAQA